MKYARKYMGNQEVDEIDELYRRLALQSEQIEDLQRKMYRRQQHGHWVEPTFLNGVDQAPAPLDVFAYRIWTGGRIQFKGHLDISGATSPVVAFVIPPATTNIHSDMTRHTVVTNATGTTFQVALVRIIASSGNVIFTWPAT